VCRNAENNHLRLTFGHEGGGGGGRGVGRAKNHLQLAFGCEGGGGGGSRIETLKSTTSSSHFDAREVVVAGTSGVILSWWYGQ